MKHFNQNPADNIYRILMEKESFLFQINDRGLMHKPISEQNSLSENDR